MKSRGRFLLSSVGVSFAFAWLAWPAAVDKQAAGKELLQLLEDATLASGNKNALKKIERARELVDQGADLTARGERGRTALHWVAIGSTQSSNKKVQEAYRELAEDLIEFGIDVNAEDDYGNSALDWEEVSPEQGLHYVLLQAGAERGRSHNETNRMIAYVGELRALAAKSDWNALRKTLDAGVPAGTTIPVRLTTPVSSKMSRSGVPVRAVVIAPVYDGGRVVLSPYTEVEGTVLLARPASNRNVRADLAIDLTTFLHADGNRTALATRVMEVRNARETVSHGHIIGPPFPHQAVRKWMWGVRGVGFVLPGVSEGFRWATEVYNYTLHREIEYADGVELFLKVTVPEQLGTKAPQTGWEEIRPSGPLEELVRAQPLRVRTPSGEPSDITNLLFLGPAQDIETAFQQAGWVEARDSGVVTGLRSFAAALRKSGFDEAPFSKLLLDEKEPDYEYQKSLNTVAKRHHLRIYKRPEKHQGQDVWIASATHDIGIGVGRRGTHWYHLIDPEIDLERQKIADDLLFTKVARGYSLVERPEAPQEAENATGDTIRTDGRMLVLHMGEKLLAAR